MRFLRFLVLGLGLLPALAWARWDVGPGMEYYSVVTYARDVQGQYFETLMQSTLVNATVEYAEKPWTFRVSGGWTDWNVSGEWNGTYVNALSSEPFFWSRQRHMEFTALLNVIGGLDMGVDYSERNLVHYNDGLTQIVFLDIRTQATSVVLQYAVLDIPSVQVNLAALYAPYIAVVAEHHLYFDPELPTLNDYQTQGVGTRWQGKAQLNYRDSAGWGLDIIYSAGYARFGSPQNLSKFTLRDGSLTGYFIFWF